MHQKNHDKQDEEKQHILFTWALLGDEHTLATDSFVTMNVKKVFVF